MVSMTTLAPPRILAAQSYTAFWLNVGGFFSPGGDALNEFGTVAAGNAGVVNPFDPTRSYSTPPSLGRSFPSVISVNDAGVSVGTDVNESNIIEAYRYDPATGIASGLGLVDGGGTSSGRNSRAVGINNAGVVVGYSSNAIGLPEAFRWDPITGMQGLGFLGAPQTIGLQSFATGINNAGQIVGRSSSVSGQRAFLWDPTTESMASLGVLDAIGNFSEASAINDAGVVVGRSFNSDGNAQAFVWDAASGMRGLSFLGAPAGASLRSAANAINASGLVVGHTLTQTVGSFQNFQEAVIWNAATGSVQTIAAFTGLSEYYFRDALSINDRGDILVSGFNLNSQENGTFLLRANPTDQGPLTPVPEPNTLLLLLIGLGALAYRGRVRSHGARPVSE